MTNEIRRCSQLLRAVSLINWHSNDLFSSWTGFAFNGATEARLLVGCPVLLLGAHDFGLVIILHRLSA